MATDSGGTISARVRECSDLLHKRCLQKPIQNYSQVEILRMKIIPDDNINLLRRCVNYLISEHLFKLFQQDGYPVWRAVTNEIAGKLAGMTGEERIIFDYIDASYREGIWTKTLKTRANVHQSVLTRCLKSLESKNLIKPIKSVKYPTRKMYMMASLTPSDDLTGGPWYTDNELDLDFIKEICKAIEKFVLSKSYAKRSPEPKRLKHPAKMDLDQDGAPVPPVKEEKRLPFLPYQAGYTGYTTVPEITSWINDMKLVNESLLVPHVETLLDVLIYDGKVQKLGSKYKALLPRPGSTEMEEGNALTEAPCGKCPVFNLCEEGGPVSASSCQYFKDWLDF